jgi:hypothetical protein
MKNREVLIWLIASILGILVSFASTLAFTDLPLSKENTLTSVLSGLIIGSFSVIPLLAKTFSKLRYFIAFLIFLSCSIFEYALTKISFLV